MDHKCKRDCFVRSRLYRKGRTYDLPEETSDKNFAPLEPTIADSGISFGVTEEAAEEQVVTEETSEHVCPDCDKEFKAKIGLIGHMKTHKEK